MKKSFFSLLLFLFNGLALADSSCSDIPGKQSHAPLKITDGVVCFVEQASFDPQGDITSVEIEVHAIIEDSKPVKAINGGLISDGGHDLGTIVDAFTLNIDHDGKDEVIVIHSVEIRYTLAEQNSSGVFYDVTVFTQNENVLYRNERASEWFGHGYSWLSDGNKFIRKFPYLTKQSIKQAINSPYAGLLVRDEVIPVIVKRKSYFYESPMLYGKPTKYLIAGDKATVDRYTAGWCLVSYTSGKKPLQMWMMCDALELDTDKK
jgi:hypothetical protein